MSSVLGFETPSSELRQAALVLTGSYAATDQHLLFRAVSEKVETLSRADLADLACPTSPEELIDAIMLGLKLPVFDSRAEYKRVYGMAVAGIVNALSRGAVQTAPDDLVDYFAAERGRENKRLLTAWGIGIEDLDSIGEGAKLLGEAASAELTNYQLWRIITTIPGLDTFCAFMADPAERARRY